MDITQIRYFLKTAELLNYTKAAEELYITRQSLRQAIAVMETDIGHPLFNNTKNKLSLTEYGEYLYTAGTKVVMDFDELQSGLQNLTSNETVLHIALSESLFPFILPTMDQMLKGFQTKYPHIHLDIQYLSNDEVIHLTENNAIDCGCVIQMPCERNNCTMYSFQQYEVAIDFAKDFPLKGNHAVTIEDLKDFPLISMGNLETTMAPIAEYCKKKHITLNYQTVTSTIDAFYLIDHGKAVGFDILKTDVPSFSWETTAILKDYLWQIGFLCNNSTKVPYIVQMFIQYILSEYNNPAQ